MIRLPGLIDVHVHMREPGAAHKEIWRTGTTAALAGGITTVLAMPNTNPPVTDLSSLHQAQMCARSQAYCDYGMFIGATADNAVLAANCAHDVVGLKMYLDSTFGSLRLAELSNWLEHVRTWPQTRPIAVHAEGTTLAAIIGLAATFKRPVHLCHVSRRDEIELIRIAKQNAVPVTCEVTPHHLFLCDDDIPRLGQGFCEVRPRLATAQDRQALWQHLDIIDCFATDHAPHSVDEKQSDSAPPGMPGLETALPLLMTAVQQGRLSVDDIVQRMYENPRRIFALKEQKETWIEVDTDTKWEIGSLPLHSLCQWTPFAGVEVTAKVRRVVLRGQEVFADDQLRVQEPCGQQVLRLS